MSKTLFNENIYSQDIEALDDRLTSVEVELSQFPDELKNLTTFEIQQLQNLNSLPISSTNWGYVSNADQPLKTTDIATFASLSSGGYSFTFPGQSGTLFLSNQINNLADLNALTAAELQQLQNIGSSAISGTKWGYLAALDQLLTTTTGAKFLDIDVTQIKNGSLLFTLPGTNGTIALTTQIPTINNLTDLNDLTALEIQQLQNINTLPISSTQWGYLSGLNQALTTTSSPTFVNGTFTTGNITTCKVTTLNPLAASPSNITLNTNLRGFYDTGGAAASNGLAFNTTLFTTMPNPAATVGDNSIRGYNGGYGGSRGYLDIGAGGTSQFCGIAFDGWMPGGDDDANINMIKFFTSGVERVRITSTEFFSNLGSLKIEGMILSDRTMLIDNDAINLNPLNTLQPGEIRATLVPGGDSGTLILSAGGLNSVLNWTGVICNNDSGTPANCGIRFYVKGVEKFALSNTGVYNLVLIRSATLTSRPAYSAVALQNEIRANYIADNSDGGLLRLSAGGGTAPSASSYIDIYGYSSTPDINQNITLNIAGNEVTRFTSLKQVVSNVDITGDCKIGNTLTSVSGNLNISCPSFAQISLKYSATIFAAVTSVGLCCDTLSELTLNNGVVVGGVTLKTGLVNTRDPQYIPNQHVNTTSGPTFTDLSVNTLTFTSGGNTALNHYEEDTSTLTFTSTIFQGPAYPTATGRYNRVGKKITILIDEWTHAFYLSGSSDVIVTNAIPTAFRPTATVYGFGYVLDDIVYRQTLVKVQSNGVLTIYRDLAQASFTLGISTFTAFSLSVVYLI